MLIDGGVSMTIPRFLSRWWRPLLVIALVLAAVTTYALARGDGAPGGEFSASPTTSSAAESAEPTTEPSIGPGEAAGPGGGVTPPTGNAPNGTTGPKGPGPGTRITTSSTTTSRQTTTRPPKSEHWAIRWILSLGPDAPRTPIRGMEPYFLLLERKCGEALAKTKELHGENPESAVFYGAATACLAAFHQQPERWEEARRYLAIANSDGGVRGCEKRALLEWLRLIVGLHEGDPDRAFVAQEPQGFYTTIGEVMPASGKEGDQVQVKGRNLGCSFGVRVVRGTQEVSVESSDFKKNLDGSITFRAPGGFSPGPATLEIQGDETWVLGRVTFTYKAEGADSSPDSSAGG